MDRRFVKFEHRSLCFNFWNKVSIQGGPVIKMNCLEQT